MRVNKIINFGASVAVLRFNAEQTFAHTLDVTYSQETDYRYRDASGNKVWNTLSSSTKTITAAILSEWTRQRIRTARGGGSEPPERLRPQKSRRCSGIL